MSGDRAPANPRRPQGMFGPGSGLGMGLPPEKARDFRGTLRRMGARLRPERLVIALVLVLGVVSVFFAVIGPKLLGDATRARQILGWKQKVSLPALVEMMMKADLDRLAAGRSLL